MKTIKMMLLASIATTATAQEAGTSVGSPSWVQLDEVTVSGKREQSYVVQESVTATRTETPLLQLPQTVNVISRTLMDEQDLRTPSDALVNVSGVTPIKTSELVLANPVVRGFNAEVYVDGLGAFGPTATADPSSLLNIDRIEVIKGPTGNLLGGGVGSPLGGVINLVSKQPQSQASRTVGLRGGSFSTVNPYFDINQPIAGQSLLFRMTGEYLSSDGPVDHVQMNRWNLNPTLSSKLGDSTTLLLRGQFNQVRQLEYAGLPAAVMLENDYSIDPYRFSGSSNAPKTEIVNQMVTGTLKHSFAGDAKFTMDLRWYRNRFDEYGSFPWIAFYPPTGSSYPLLRAYLPTDVREFTAAPRVEIPFATGMLKHRVLVGVDYDKTIYKAMMYFDLFPYATINYADAAADPDFGSFDPASPYNGSFGTDASLLTNAATVQDQIDVGSRVHVLAGARYVRLKIDQLGYDHIKGYRVLPRMAASVDLADGLAAFSGYSEGYRAPLFTSAGSPVKPEHSSQIEAGIKFAPAFSKLSGNASIYELTRDDVPTPDPSNPFLQVQNGKQRSRGAELDLIWEPTPQLSTLFSYAYTRAVVRVDNSIPVGDRLRRTPGNSGRAAVRYRFKGALDGLGLGLGMTGVSSREITLPNRSKAPGYAVFDAQASYGLRQWQFTVSAANLLDRTAYDPYLYLDQAVVTPVQPRSAFASVRYTF